MVPNSARLKIDLPLTPPHSPVDLAHGRELDASSSARDMDPSRTSSAAADSKQSFDPLEGYTSTRSAAATSAPRSVATTSRADSRVAPSQARPSGSKRNSSTRSTRMDTDEHHEMGRGEGATMRPPVARGTTGFRRGMGGPASGLRPKSVQPPKDPELFDTDEAFQAHAHEERASGWHHLPLFLVGLPAIGAIVHGRAENWSDAIILALVVFYLYQLIKVPWELYYASYARYILPPGIEPSTDTSQQDEEDLELVAQRAESARALRRNELVALGWTFLVPVIGASLLHYARGLLSDPDRYINRFMIGLFAIASGIKPLLHLVKLVKRNSLYHQEVVHYPSSRVHQLQKRLDRLEKELAQLSRTAVPLSTFQSLSSSLNSTLTPLQRQLRRQTLETQHAQLSSTERLSALAGAVDELCLAFQAQEQELQGLRDVVGAAALVRGAPRRALPLGNAATVLVSVVKHLVLYLAATAPSAHERRGGVAHANESPRHGLAWYAFSWPVTVPRALIGWAVKGTAQGAVKALGWEGDAQASAAEASAVSAANGTFASGIGRRRIAEPPIQYAGARRDIKQEEKEAMEVERPESEGELEEEEDGLSSGPEDERSTGQDKLGLSAAPSRRVHPRSQPQHQPGVPGRWREVRTSPGLAHTASRSTHRLQGSGYSRITPSAHRVVGAA